MTPSPQLTRPGRKADGPGATTPPSPADQPKLLDRLRHALPAGHYARRPARLLDHKDVKTTMIYTHVLNKGGPGVRSPVDGL